MDLDHDTYARWLDRMVRVAFVLTAAVFALYVLRVLPAYVPLDALPALWRLPLAQYLERSGAPVGWAWLPLVGRADYLNLAAVALFALMTLVCYLRVIPLLPRLQAAFALAQVLVLLAAISGLV
ncbi:MAG TPA: hypothetical protein VL982_10560 [Burkholderiales bacterium]|jgi:hypothetical protein|nr:hypothetical protein [Burkholderiales bacterium]